jgi:hypothetical protein
MQMAGYFGTTNNGTITPELRPTKWKVGVGNQYITLTNYPVYFIIGNTLSPMAKLLKWFFR